MPVGVMLAVMDSREMLYWQALAIVEREERLERDAKRRAESKAAELKATRPKMNKSRDRG